MSAVNGREFFFQNVCIKVQQVPNMFIDDSQNQPEDSHSFIVMVLEKQSRKRQTSKTDFHQIRMAKLKQEKKFKGFGHEQTQLKIREKKMGRYSNYFLSLFDLERIVPFNQMVKPKEVDAIREDIQKKVANFLEKIQND